MFFYEIKLSVLNLSFVDIVPHFLLCEASENVRDKMRKVREATAIDGLHLCWTRNLWWSASFFGGSMKKGVYKTEKK